MQNVQHDPDDNLSSPTPYLIPTPSEREAQELAAREERAESDHNLLLQLQREQTKAQTLQARATLAIVGLTVGGLAIALTGGIVAYLQFQAASQSATIAADTLTAMKRSASESSIQTEKLLSESAKSSKAASASAATAQTSLEVSERPWVSATGFGVSQPLQFDPVKGATLGISYAVRNTGHSPALHVMLRNKLVTLSMTKLGNKEIQQDQHELCDPLLTRPSSILDETLFPGDATQHSEIVGLSQSQLSDALVRRDTSRFPHHGFVTMMVIACADYETSFSEQHHQTWYAFSLAYQQDNGGFNMDLNPERVYPEIKLIYFGQSAD